MRSSKLTLSEITDKGKSFSFSGGDFEGAFVVLITNAVPGSIPHPDSAKGHLIGFSNICTHLGCGVQLNPNSTSEQIITKPCLCHGTSFDLTRQGLVILGQATQNLPQLQLKIVEDEVEAFDWVRNLPELDISPEEEQWPLRA